MSQTRILCSECGYPQVYCTCPPESVVAERIDAPPTPPEPRHTVAGAGDGRKDAVTITYEERLRKDRVLLRAQLAAAVDALEWALGTNGDFRRRTSMDGGKYYWRKELAERAGLRWNGYAWIYDAAIAAAKRGA